MKIMSCPIMNNFTLETIKYNLWTFNYVRNKMDIVNYEKWTGYSPKNEYLDIILEWNIAKEKEWRNK